MVVNKILKCILVLIIFIIKLIIFNIPLILSITSLVLAIMAFRKDNMVKLLVQFEPYYKDDVILIQSYNKSKIGAAFRFNGIFFSQYKRNCKFKEEIKEKEIILNDNLLETNINPKKFEIIEPFSIGETREVNYDKFIKKSAYVIQNDNKLKEKILAGEKSIYIVIVYEESLGKKEFFKTKLNSKKGDYNKLYNDILKKLETKEKEKFPVQK